jgi:hypothetical protein
MVKCNEGDPNVGCTPTLEHAHKSDHQSTVDPRGAEFPNAPPSWTKSQSESGKGGRCNVRPHQNNRPKSPQREIVNAQATMVSESATRSRGRNGTTSDSLRAKGVGKQETEPGDPSPNASKRQPN